MARLLRGCPHAAPWLVGYGLAHLTGWHGRRRGASSCAHVGPLRARRRSAMIWDSPTIVPPHGTDGSRSVSPAGLLPPCSSHASPNHAWPSHAMPSHARPRLFRHFFDAAPSVRLS